MNRYGIAGIERRRARCLWNGLWGLLYLLLGGEEKKTKDYIAGSQSHLGCCDYCCNGHGSAGISPPY